MFPRPSLMRNPPHGPPGGSGRSTGEPSISVKRNVTVPVGNVTARNSSREPRRCAEPSARRELRIPRRQPCDAGSPRGGGSVRPRTLHILVFTMALTACSNQAPSGHRSVSPSPSIAPAFGRVDIGGYELAWMCQGEGSLTIIAEAGYDSAGTSTFFESMGPMSTSAGSARTDPRRHGDERVPPRRGCTSRASSRRRNCTLCWRALRYRRRTSW